MTETDVLAELEAQTGRSWQGELQAWVHSTQELPIVELLAQHGVQAVPDTATPAQALGLRVQEAHSVLIKQVLRDSVAERAGLMAGDEWYGVEVVDSASTQSWRLAKLDELALYVPQGTSQITALVARDRQLLRMPMTLPSDLHQAPGHLRLQIEDASAVDRWLAA